MAGVPAIRVAERVGRASEARPDTTLLWFHAVSAGEALSILGLVRVLGDRLPEAAFLVTTTSVTSAQLVAERRPPRTRHQFAPLDTPGAVTRFLHYWRPDLAVFVQSELWPRQILAARAAGVPLVLINASLSDRSLARWQRCRGLARTIFESFSCILAKDSRTLEGLIKLGTSPARIVANGDLKAAADPLPVDEETRAEFVAAIGGRPLWVAASTHQGEEQAVAEAHRAGLAVHRGLLLIIVPRHPSRGPAIAGALRAEGWNIARRAAGESLTQETQIYLADTFGETGLWYRLSPLVFLGGSLVPAGGHNPFEPASLGAAVVHGPHVANFADVFRDMDARGAARGVADAAELARVVPALVTSQDLSALRQQARIFADGKRGMLDDVAGRLIAVMAEGRDAG
jgi:3-deoxy-D-manno-octulosonic-acid transferase